jgi:hypothetical protein
MALATARILTLCDVIVAEMNTTLAISTNYPGTSAVRGYSMGFQDGELSRLRIVVRPYDYGFGDGGNSQESDKTYTVEIGLARIMAKANSPLDAYLNLAIATSRLYYLKRSLVIDPGTQPLLVTGNRFMPLFFRDTDTMDSQEPVTKFDSRLHLEFTELGRANSEAT